MKYDLLSELNLDALVGSINNEVIGWRRYLHENPELSFQEERTAQFVYDKLNSFGGLEISRPTKTSIVARLIGSHSGKVLAIRADMDALPIQEENEIEFSSKKDGIMHACGHDGHTAMLLGTAKLLCSFKEKIKGEIRFIFQHAEELPPGGAIEMVNAGVLDGVDLIIGAHLTSNLETGKIGLNYGPIMAGADMFKLTIFGEGGHASQPNQTIDPILIGTEVVTNLQHIVSRKIDPIDTAVISVTQFNGGTAVNVIPNFVTIGGSVRSFKPEIRNNIPKLIEQIVKGITDAHGAKYEIEYHYGYSPVINDEVVTSLIDKTVCELFGEENRELIKPIMGSEDFSAFLLEAPGSYFFVGARNESKGIVYPHHHPKFNIDERALKDGIKIFVQGAINILNH
ncbi:M20 family metallopeptidase [Bacillus sp. AFS041924]|uniref:M20 family metallopeptidase n=1 Tax=Bacillus sp. AFS041924 TaxID=2033503 RepID=UPI000BFC910D|nr:M20 family metallopeptidase [Bacillus sp. AFS041924]PGS50355.1 N-acyl-L-amino acid amidohydrolase [Bacillus sp. AFS041924]